MLEHRAANAPESTTVCAGTDDQRSGLPRGRDKPDGTRRRSQ
jgi:hypothetical protein